MADITTIAELGTAGGTLILAIATFGSVRSANRAARVAERSLQIGLRPLLVESRREDPPEPAMFGSGKVLMPGNGLATVERDGDDIAMAIPLRNVGAGMAVLHGWHIVGGWQRQRQEVHPELDEFRQQLRDLYVPPSDTGFWQASIRGPDDKYRSAVEAALGNEEEGFSVFLLYGDHEGGQRTISRFGLRPHGEEGRWYCSETRHWSLEGTDPRASAR
jgi:predicted Rdx family selenoprotein